MCHYDNEDGSEVFASPFIKEGHLFPIGRKWDKIEEVFTSFTAQDELKMAAALAVIAKVMIAVNRLVRHAIRKTKVTL